MSATEDGEVSAMRMVAEALEPLDVAARSRVIDWAKSRFGTIGNLTENMLKLIEESATENRQLKLRLAAHEQATSDAGTTS